SLQVADYITFHAQHGIAPARLVSPACEPVIGQSGPADEADIAIHNQKLPVRAVIDPGQASPAHVVVELHPASRINKGFAIFSGCAEASNAIKHQVDLYASPRPLRERLKE